MNLFGFNISRVPRKDTRNTQHETRSIDPNLAAWLKGETTDSTGSVLTNAYQQVVWVYRAINVLAEQVANIPFLFSRGERGRESLITSGPLHQFYDHPHPHLNRFQYWELRIIWLMLRGECFRLPIYQDARAGHSLAHSDHVPQSGLTNSGSKLVAGLGSQWERAGVRASGSPIKNRKSKIKNVVYLDPARMQHIVQDHRLVGWRYTGAGLNEPVQPQVFLPEEIWFERLPNPFDFWRGMPPLMVADFPARTDFAASAFMRGTMENNADTGLIVRSDQLLGEEQREQVLATLRNRKRKAGTADRPIFLWGVNEIVKPELSSADLEFLANRKFSRSEICAAFGVPEEIVTTTDKAKYDVMAGARLNFIENRIIPLCARLEAEENATTIPAITNSISGENSLAHSEQERAGVRASGSSIEIQNSKFKNAIGWFDVDSLPIMQEARRHRLAAAKTGFDMGIPFNELNRVFDLGFKSLPWGNNGYLKSNLTAAGTVSESSPAAPKSDVGGSSKSH